MEKGNSYPHASPLLIFSVMSLHVQNRSPSMWLARSYPVEMYIFPVSKKDVDASTSSTSAIILDGKPYKTVGRLGIRGWDDILNVVTLAPLIHMSANYRKSPGCSLYAVVFEG